MFKYKVRRPPHQELPLGKPFALKPDQERLSGMIQGMKASDIEERFARALSADPRVDGYSFRFPIISPRSMPGQLELDFVVQSGANVYAFQVDGQMSHKGVGKQQDDARKDVIANEFMSKKYNSFPVKRIPYFKLETQDQANQLIRELIR